MQSLGKDARAALGRFLRKASWMGGTRAAPAPVSPPYSVAEPVPVVANPVVTEPASAIEEPTAEPAPAREVVWPETVPPGVFSPAVLPDAAALGVVAVTGQGPAVELRITLGNRSWRVRGLDRVSSFEALRVNVLVARTDTPPGAVAAGFHVDTLDLYSARARGCSSVRPRPS